MENFKIGYARCLIGETVEFTDTYEKDAHIRQGKVIDTIPAMYGYKLVVKCELSMGKGVRIITRTVGKRDFVKVVH